MRVLKTEEVKNVSGGTFGLLACLFGGLFSWGRSSYCAPAPQPVPCAPAPQPAPCAPVVNTCHPRRSWGRWC